MPLDTRTRKRFLSLYTMSILLLVTALVYVGAIGAHLSLRFRPAVQNIVRDGEAASERFTRFRERAMRHEMVLASLWAEWRARSGGVASADSIGVLRAALQRLAAENAPGSAERASLTSSPEFARVAERATRTEAALRGELREAIAAVERGELAPAGRMMVRADSLRASLAAAVTEANDLAIADVRAREQELVQVTDEGTRIVLLWFVLGVLLSLMGGAMLRRRLKEPLTELDEGLLRISRGDLAVQLSGEGDDELGRIARRVNRTVLTLRARFRADEERSAQRSLDRARRLMDAALDAVVVLDADGAIREWNPQATTMFGWEREQMIGVNLISLLFPDEVRDHAAAERLAAVLAGDATELRQRLRAIARRGDGSFVPIEMGLTAFASGKETEFAVFIRDVSGEAAAHDALMTSEARYRAAFDQSAVGIAEVDPDGHVLRMNAAMLTILGRHKPVEAGRAFVDLLPPDQSAEDLRDFDLLRRGVHAHLRRERVYRRPNGTTQSIDLTASTVSDATGALAYFLVTAQDVSARAQLERDLRQAHKMDAVGQLAGGVAHDFNNILAGIIGYADLLEQEASATDSIRHEARAIAATAQRGADLAQKLLALARELPTSMIELDAREVMEEVHAIIKRAFDRNIEVRLDMDDVPVGVRADRTQLSNALLNLCLNARDAMPRGGRLTMRARHVTLDEVACAQFIERVEPGRYVALVVTDTGGGIAREVIARIFEPFFTTKEQGKGTGLGLAMVYGMVRAHSGVVDVESAIGVGSTFSIFLPALERVAPAAAKAPAPKLITGRGEVLLADDETTVREVATRMLSRLGYTVEAVADGEQAIARFRAEPDRYTFVLLDGDMPRMHGRDAAKHMRQLRPDVRIFLATGYLIPAHADSNEPSPFTAILAKPYTLQELSRVISAHLGEASAAG